jgi:methionine-gamma-lyase
MRHEDEEEITGRRLAPESLMMGYGYDPALSEGALKSPVFQTSTFVFSSAAEGKRFFELAYGLREPDPGEEAGLIYSRINNPDLEILEDRLCVWDDAERGLAFASGMAGISTTFTAHLRPGDVLVHTVPLYGGTDHLVRDLLPAFGVRTVEWRPGADAAEILSAVHRVGGTLELVFMETPANPPNQLFDIEMARRIADKFATEQRRPLVAVDNTFLGPIWQRPLEFGADLVLYSATKYLGGHGDLVAGAVLGSMEAIAPIAEMRTLLGTMASPWTGWLLMRSLETLDLRVRRQTATAQRVAEFLREHPTVLRVNYLGLLDADDPGHEIFKRQCMGPGAMISFELDDEAAAFAFLDAVELVKLAVSLGGTESLAEHPASMTHAGVPAEEKARLGVTEGLVRLSIGVEHPADLIQDISTALAAVENERSKRR